MERTQSQRPDSVVTNNKMMKFQGTPLAVKAWIEANDQEKLNVYHDVLIGETGEYVSVEEYMRDVVA